MAATHHIATLPCSRQMFPTGVLFRLVLVLSQHFLLTVELQNKEYVYAYENIMCMCACTMTLAYILYVRKMPAVAMCLLMSALLNVSASSTGSERLPR